MTVSRVLAEEGKWRNVCNALQMGEEKFDTGVFSNGAQVLPALPGHRRLAG